MEMIGLRYFNVFGPKQSPEGEYAAVIPLFMKAVKEGKPAIMNGDGSQTRDFYFYGERCTGEHLSGSGRGLQLLPVRKLSLYLEIRVQKI